MLETVNIYYEGWRRALAMGHIGAHPSCDLTPVTVFEYSSEALQRNLELSSYLLPLKQKTTQGFPAHHFELPGPAYDACPMAGGCS